jgi:hypothetical protein
VLLWSIEPPAFLTEPAVTKWLKEHAYKRLERLRAWRTQREPDDWRSHVVTLRSDGRCATRRLADLPAEPAVLNVLAELQPYSMVLNRRVDRARFRGWAS